MASQYEDRPKDSADLLTAALARLEEGQTVEAPARPSDELLHELEVHQIELEMLNESLRQSQAEAEESRNSYADLYDFAPVGYLTLSDKGIITKANLTAGTLLGVERMRLLDRRFDSFIAPEGTERWHLIFNVMRNEETPKFELLLKRADGSHFLSLLTSKWVTGGQNPSLRLTLTDITEHMAAVSQQSAMELEVATYSHGLDFASQRLLAVEEETKRRLAAALHDRTSPNLAAIKLNLNLLCSQFPEEAAKQSQYLEDLRALIDDTDISVRETCAELHPPALDYAGLPAALDLYARQFTLRTGIQAQFESTNCEDRLDQSSETLLFRVCQEALTNCVKHAHASAVKIKLSKVADRTALTIADDGAGFDMARMQKNGDINGLGLLNMREMAELSGGQFSIESSPGKGTQIEVSIPDAGVSEQPGPQAPLPSFPEGNAAEEYFQRFFNLIPDLACILTTEGRFLRINPRWQEVLGYTVPEILSTSFLELIHPADREATMREVDRQLAGKSTMHFINRYCCKNGSYRWLEWRATSAVGGKLLFASARDITKSKEMHDELAKLAKLVNEVEEISRLGGWTYDCASGRIAWSDETYRIYGVGMDFDINDLNRNMEFFPAEDRANIGHAFEAAIKEGKPYDLDAEFVRFNGERIWVRTIGKPTFENGKVVSVTGNIVEITERKQAQESLQASLEFSRSLIDSIQYGLSVLDLLGVHTDANHALCNMTGFSREELVGIGPPHPYWPPEEFENIEVAFQKTLRGEGSDFELIFMRKNGERFPVLVNPSLVKDRKGNTVSYIATVKDITERKQAEDRLRKIQHNLTEAQEVAHVGSWELDLVNNRLTWSAEMYRIFGIPPDEFGASYATFLDALHPDDRDMVDHAYLSSLEEGGRYDVEFRILHKSDGQLRWGHARCEHDRDANGKAIRSYGTVQDITERKQNEQVLRKSDERFRQAMEASNDGLWDWDIASDTCYFSPAYFHMLGYDFGEFPASGGNWAEAIHPDDRQRTWSINQDCIENRCQSFEVEYRMQAKDGAWKWILGRGKAIERDAQGKALRMIGTHVDITERKQATEKLQKSELQLRESQQIAHLGSWELDLVKPRLDWSEETYKLFDESPEKFSPSFDEFSRLVHSDDRETMHTCFDRALASDTSPYHVEVRIINESGRQWVMEAFGTVKRDTNGKPLSIHGTAQDITKRKQMENLVHQMAFHDPLTKLPNRHLLTDRLRQTMAASARSGCHGALMFLDLDNFKPLNDTYGHAVGDRLLIDAAHRLESCVRETDTVARFGGDEFVVMLSELNVDKVESTSQARTLAEKICSTLSEPYLLTITHEGKANTIVEHRCTVSIGVTLFLNHEASQDELFNWADTAMYQAKDAGRNLILFYDMRTSATA